LLIEAGARPHEADTSGRSPVAVAKKGGSTELARFLDHYLEVQACIVLLRTQKGSSPVGRLTGDVLQLVLMNLLPSALVDWLVMHM